MSTDNWVHHKMERNKYPTLVQYSEDVYPSQKTNATGYLMGNVALAFTDLLPGFTFCPGFTDWRPFRVCTNRQLSPSHNGERNKRFRFNSDSVQCYYLAFFLHLCRSMGGHLVCQREAGSRMMLSFLWPWGKRREGGCWCNHFIIVMTLRKTERGSNHQVHLESQIDRGTPQAAEVALVMPPQVSTRVAITG